MSNIRTFRPCSVWGFLSLLSVVGEGVLHYWVFHHINTNELHTALGRDLIMQVKGEALTAIVCPPRWNLYNYTWKSGAAGIDRSGFLSSMRHFYNSIQTFYWSTMRKEMVP